jgi:hypothetical protein
MIRLYSLSSSWYDRLQRGGPVGSLLESYLGSIRFGSEVHVTQFNISWAKFNTPIAGLRAHARSISLRGGARSVEMDHARNAIY